MKQAINAKTIGDKLYNIERIHGKIISYNKISSKEQLILTLERFRALVECFGNQVSSQKYFEYLFSVEQALHLVKRNHAYHDSLGFMHGNFVRFRRESKRLFKGGCEFEYQDFCLILLEIEGIFKREKNN